MKFLKSGVAALMLCTLCACGKNEPPAAPTLALPAPVEASVITPPSPPPPASAAAAAQALDVAAQAAAAARKAALELRQ